MSDLVTAGDIAAVFLERCGVDHAFGVISIHNMPVLDGVFRRNKINFVPARSEGGAVNMADANARVRGGLGVAVSSTGTAAGNACGAMVEALHVVEAKRLVAFADAISALETESTNP